MVNSQILAKELEQPYYFTGNPCIRGHISKRRTCNGGCWECKKQVDAKRRSTPRYKEKMRELMKDRRKDLVLCTREGLKQKESRDNDIFRKKVRVYNREYKKK